MSTRSTRFVVPKISRLFVFVAFNVGIALSLATLPVTPAHAQATANADTQVSASTPSIAIRDTPIAHFFKAGAFGGATLSPSGTQIAARVSLDGGPMMLVVVAVDTRKPKILVKGTSNVASFRWISDTRIAYSLSARDIAPGDTDLGPGLFAIDIDGKDSRQLASRALRMTSEASALASRMLPYSTAINSSIGKQDGDTIFVNVFDWNRQTGGVVNLLRLDTRTGRSETFSRPGNTVDWLLDEKSEPRVAASSEDDKSILYFRDPVSGAWQRRAEFASLDKDALNLIAYGPDGKLYVSARNGGDKSALYTFDVQTNKLSPEPLMRLEQFDFEGRPLFKNGKLAGIYYLGETQAIVWIDEEMKRLQKLVDDKLPNTNNLISFPTRGDSPNMLVNAYSDVDPGSTWLLNSKTGDLSLLGQFLPDIKPELMANIEPVRYKARDGLEIPAWLTLPQGAKKNLPLVVLVHGGPWVRGSTWRFDPQVQFLASRGYAVLQPEFRASTGFGWKHFEAGFKQWGQAMQDDVTDGARWAIAQGYVDPKRVCIAGASYGGYAALMGVLKEPELFKCAVNWVGVSDINLLYNVNWSDTSEASKTFGLPKLIGDQVKDAAMLKANSPLENAGQIRRPLLMAYGASDIRVPLEHGTRFRDAVMRNNPDVEWVAYAGEGHGWALLQNNVDFWGRVEKFLDRNIGADVKAK